MRVKALYGDNAVFKDEVGGGVDMSAVRLNNGKVLVSLLVAGGPAYNGGIKLGFMDGKSI